ncbi:MAG: hypothetical protein E3J72_19450 [Planctomycetota bacterium]|nr:MAG: hypothetical protein E3J72_19450 [Planctomycetota bacterium]
MIHLIAGIVTVVLGVWGIIAWWHDFGEVLRGLIPLLLVLGGLAAVGAGFQKTLRETENENVEKPGDGAPAHPAED